MDTSMLRLISQVLLVMWCATAMAVAVLSRGKTFHAAGLRWAVLGLSNFGVWMFLSAITIRDTELFPRGSVLWLFAAVELGTTAGAWGWLVLHVRRNFHVCLRYKPAG